MDFLMAGPALVLGLSAMGAAIGCGLAGMACHAILPLTEDDHGKYIGLSAMPSSQMIYGFVLMLLLRNSITANNVSPLSAVFIGGLAGLAIMTAAIYQGLCCVSAIQATKKQPSVFGKCFIAIGIIESFALFAFVFSLLLI